MSTPTAVVVGVGAEQGLVPMTNANSLVETLRTRKSQIPIKELGAGRINALQSGSDHAP
jgi:hypothetical protein